MSIDTRSQFALMGTTRFAPLFLTQFFGAFNDNVYKNALILIIAFGSGQILSLDAGVLTNVAAGLFILPFFLFSALAGQIADKYEKSRLIRRIKLCELGIMICGAVAFWFNHMAGLLLLLFFMGTQSAFFGPVKYSIIPQHLKPAEVVGGNAWVEMGTFVAILLGTIAGGLLCQADHRMILGGIVIAAAVAGWVSSRKIPPASPSSPDLAISLNLVAQTWKTIRDTQKSRPLFLSIVAVSWFWFLGVAYMTQFPSYARHTLGGSQAVVTLLLACFSLGIGAGSLLCERLSGRKVELGLVPLGALGLSVFGIDLYLAQAGQAQGPLMSVSRFLASPGSFRVMADLILIGISGGFYTVPLYAYIQVKADTACRARTVAANNIMNALFMVMAALAGGVAMGLLGFSAIEFFLVLSVMNIVVAACIFCVVPEFTLRFMAWAVSCVMYRIRRQGAAHIPEQGPAVLVCNHVSFVDWLLIAGLSRRPVRFVVYEPIFRIPVLNFIFRTSRSIPIDSKQKNPAVYDRAFDAMARALENGELLCIFPEGKITANGRVDLFKPGIEKVIRKTPVPVVPMAIRGMWGSFFSRKGKKAFCLLPRRFWSKVELAVGCPVLPADFSLSRLRQDVEMLWSGCDREMAPGVGR